jgi:hypothetical protein
MAMDAPEIVAPVITGLVSVLFVSVSTVFRPTSVSVAAGIVMVPNARAAAFNRVMPLVDPASPIVPGSNVCSADHVCGRIGTAGT